MQEPIDQPLEWRPIAGYEGLYEVSNYGDVRKANTNRILSLYRGERYIKVGLTKNKVAKTHLVHRLVANAFINNPDNYPEINHKYFNRHDNRSIMLEWCTRKMNNDHSIAGGRHFNSKVRIRTRGALNRHSKKVIQCDLNGIALTSFGSIREVERLIGIKSTCVCRVLKNKALTAGGFKWKYA